MKIKTTAIIGIFVVILCALLGHIDSFKFPEREEQVFGLSKKVLKELYEEVYDEILSVMVDKEDRKAAHEYTVAHSMSFSGIEYINVKIFFDKTGQMTVKYFDDEFIERGQVTYNKQILLTKEQTEQITNVFEENNFWYLPKVHPDDGFGMDGCIVFVEGRNWLRHNFIAMWDPHVYGKMYEIEEIYDGVMEYAELWGLSIEH